MGRYDSLEMWRKKAYKAAQKQAKKPPALYATEKTENTVFPAIRGEDNTSFKAWQQACLALGVDSDIVKREIYKFFVDADIENQEYTAGNAMLLYSLLVNGYETDDKVRRAAEAYCKKAFVVAGDGTLPYNCTGSNRYVDVLGMVCPFLIKYHLTYGCPEALELAKRQLDEYCEYGIHSVIGLPVHCFNTNSKMPLGIYGWGRGCGWLAFALAECSELLKGRDDYADVLLERSIRYSKALGRFQFKNGGFSCMLGSGNRVDSSATAMIGWFYAVMASQSANKEYLIRAQAARKYLMSVTRRDGKVDFAQGDTMGIGNYSRRFEPLPVAQGFALRLDRSLENLLRNPQINIKAESKKE